MKKTIVCLLLLVNGYVSLAKEGMWLPYLIGQLNHQEMTAMGLQISAEDIYSVNQSSIKDAIVHFNGGCTAEIISNKGLLLTNHHCGYSQIQSHSSLENDYLKDGFWAMSPKEELTNKNLTAAIVKYMEEVTNTVLEGVQSEMSADDRQSIIDKNIEALLEAKTEEAAEYDYSVVPFFYGNQYILVAKETFKDVRLVGAPPSVIGKFGADTDNWMWPRHTGDFSVFRIYAGKDNKPAEYAEDNVPYQPNYHLKVNIGGVAKNDFSMIYGFPGTTQEYLPATEIQNTIEVYDPARIAVRDQILKILDRKMRVNDATRIQYASKYARISNSWKKWIGEVKGLKETDAVAKKQNFENEFKQAIAKDEALNNEYGDVLPTLDALYEARKSVMLQRYYYIEIGYYGIEMSRHMLRYYNLVTKYEEEDENGLKDVAQKLSAGMPTFYKDYDALLDEEVALNLLPVYLKQMDDENLPLFLIELKALSDEKLQKFIKDMYADNMVIAQADEFENMLNENPEKVAKKIAKSDAYQLSKAMYEHFVGVLNPQVKEANAVIEQSQAAYVNAIQKVFPNKRFYPDANSTLRVAYGSVEGYAPRDAVEYGTHTYLSGVIAKYVPGDYEFDLPQKLIELYEQKDFGPYAEGDKMPVCFIASNHTTGGNSGSPALNANGELVGLNFDRAWEGTMSDINYDISRCRNIMVDIRYVLFIIDKYAGAKYLVDEMDLVYKTPVNKDEAMAKP